MARPLSELRLEEGQKLTPEQALALIIRERRKELRLTQEGLAADVLDPSYISKLERGAREIGLGTFLVLAERLQMEPRDLVDAVVKRMEHRV